MNKLKAVWNIIYRSVGNIFRFWPRVILRALIITLITFVSVWLLDAMFDFIAYLFERYVLGRLVVFGEIFHSSYLVGVGIIFLVIFSYLVLHFAAERFRTVEVAANKNTWNDVFWEIYKSRELDLYGDGIMITSKKPNQIHNLSAWIKTLQENKFESEFAGGTRLAFVNEKSRKPRFTSTEIDEGKTVKFVVAVVDEEYSGNPREGDIKQAYLFQEIEDPVKILPGKKYVATILIKGNIALNELKPFMEVRILIMFENGKLKIYETRLLIVISQIFIIKLKTGNLIKS